VTLGGHIVDPEGGHISGPGDPERGHITWPLTKIQQTFFYRLKVWKIIGRQNLSLDNRKIDFNLVKPTGMGG